MKLPARPDVAILVVLGLVVVGIAACSLARVDVPSILSELGILLAGIAGGAAIPGGSQPAAPEPVLPPAPAPAAVYPPPPALVAEPATGVFPRVANHL